MTSNTKITIDELLTKLDQEDFTEADLATYLNQTEFAESSLEPQFELNEDRVSRSPETVAESAALLNFANFAATKIRYRKYKKDLRDAKKEGRKIHKVVAEGDSWWQYPIKLEDIIDHVSDHRDIAVRCFSAAGDILTNMNAQGQFIQGIISEQPDYFLFSGGGNDLVDGRGIRRYVRKYSPHLQPKDYLLPEYEGFRKLIAQEYTSVIQKALNANPKIAIMCHGYAHVFPTDKGKWLGKPMRKSLGITDPELQQDIMRIIVDDINNIIRHQIDNAVNAGAKAQFFDARSIVTTAGEWDDEFHLTSEAYKRVAQPMIEYIRES